MAPSSGDGADRFAWARVEQELREQLQHEQARSAALERELATLQSSEAFRIGHALVIALNQRLIWRPAALGRKAARALSRRPRSRRWIEPASEAEPSTVETAKSNAALFVAWGADEERLERYVEQVERLTAVLVDIRPVFLTDSTAIAPLRARGYPCEYVIPLGEWRRHRAAYDWGPYVTERVAAVQRRHRPGVVVVLAEDEVPSVLDQGVLNVLILPSVGEGDDNRIR